LRRNNKLKKNLITLCLAAIFAVICIFTPFLKGVAKVMGGITAPIQSGAAKVTNSVSGTFKYWGRIKNVDKENASLKKENEKLKEENRNLSGYKEQINKLNELLELKGDYTNYETTAATVIGKDAGNWFNVFTLNKGEKDGVKENSVVIVPQGIVGRVCEVGPNWSKVISLIDEDHSVSGTVVRTGDLVQLDGDLQLMKSGFCKMSVITENADVLIGDTIVTSGIGGIYPEGIYIGTVQSFKNNTEGTGNYAIITPGVDFAHIKDVLILLNTEGVE